MKHQFTRRPFLLYAGLFLGGLFANSASSFGQTYCTPSYSTGCAVGDDISNVTLNGATVNLNNSTTACSGNAYQDYTNLNHPDLIQGSTYNISVSTSYGSPEYENVRIWIDYDNDGTFANSEEIAAALTPASGISSTGTSTFSFTVPATVSTGLRRLRVRLGYYSSSIDPCTMITYGETEDYTVNVMPLAPPDNAGVDSLVSPNDMGDFCSGVQEVKVRVSNLGKNPLSSVNVDWSVDGVLQTGKSLTFNPAIDSINAPNHDTVISLGYVDFPFETGVQIKAWTSSPNGVTDTDPTDDTLNLNVIAHMQGVISHITPGDTAICAGKSIILDAGQQPAGCIFIWSNGAVTQSTSVNQAGSYSVAVQSLQGCFAYDTVTIGANPPLMAGVFGAVDNGGGNFAFTAVGDQNVTNYFWDFGDGFTQSGPSNTQTHHYSQDGTYAVVLKEGNSCDTVVLSKQIYVSTTPSGIAGVKGLDALLKIYPNPANDKLTISAQNQIQLQQLTIYNVLGAKVFHQALSGSQLQISIAQLPAGVYQLRVQTNKGMMQQRLEILR